ncbi:MAG: type transport system permease protein, partial [Acidimicrobiaceae bacterium]|nr:type transport system permease protein [Acidimicrobiaceae bacterium]
MTTTTFVPSVGRAVSVGPGGVSLRRTFRAEWTKIRTLRSTWMTVGISAVVSITLAAVVCASNLSQWDSMSVKERLAFDGTSNALIGVLFATVIIGSLAVRAITSEYSSGMIRLTFSAVPRRRAVLAAKAALMAAVAFPVALASNLAAFFVGQQILASKSLDTSIGHPGVVTAIVFGALAVSLVAVIGVGLGTVMRRTASATTVLSLVIIGSQLLGLALPEVARQYLPGFALQAV